MLVKEWFEIKKFFFLTIENVVDLLGSLGKKTPVVAKLMMSYHWWASLMIQKSLSYLNHLVSHFASVSKYVTDSIYTIISCINPSGL